MYLGMVFFSDISCHKTGTVLASYPASSISFVFPHFRTRKLQDGKWIVHTYPLPTYIHTYIYSSTEYMEYIISS